MPVLTKVFSSTHSGAPVLAGNDSGAFAALLDAVLVNGYNSKTITLTRSGSTATASCISHGFATGQVLAISGADQADYNGEFRIAVTDANTFTYTVSGTPASPATGTITAKVAPLGWSTAYASGTTERSYQRPGSSRGFYMNIGAGADNRQARIRMFETVTAAGTAAANGTNPTPADASISGGHYMHWSSTTDGTVRSWYAFGNAAAFVLVALLDATPSYLNGLYVGNIEGGHATYGTVIWAPSASGYTNTWWSVAGSDQSSAGSYPQGAYVLRPLSGTGGSERVGVSTHMTNNSTPGATNVVTYATYGLFVNRPWTCQAGRGVFGYLPGLWFPMSMRPLSNLDTFQGAAGSSLAGKSFLCLSGASSPQLYVETSDDW